MYRTHAHHTRNGEDGAAKRPRLDPSSPGDSSDGDRRQDRLEAIAEELRSLGERTEELVTAAQQVRENNDVSSIHSLQHQMEIVQNKQTQLLLEQSDLLKQPLPTRSVLGKKCRFFLKLFSPEFIGGIVLRDRFMMRINKILMIQTLNYLSAMQARRHR